MKKALLLIAVLSIGFSMQKANARGRIPVGSVEKIEKVADLPDNDNYKLKDGKYIDLGVKFTVFSIAFIPVYTEKEPELVGYANEDTYYDIPKEELSAMLAENKLDEKNLLKLSFWNAWGGKLIIGALILLIIYGAIPSRKKKRDEEITPQAV